MLAYANPPNRSDEKQRADGYGLARFKKSTREVTFECYKRFTDVTTNKDSQFPGWPITFNARNNDGRKPAGHIDYEVDLKSPVVQVINDTTKEILYTARLQKPSGKLPVYSSDPHTVRIGKNKPSKVHKEGVKGE